MAVDTRLGEFVAAEYPRVVAAVALITGDRAGADDAVQDALVGYLASPPTREIRNLAAWITVVASNHARGGARRTRAEERAYSRVDLGSSTAADEPALRLDVRAALATLPERQREVCTLHYLLDQSVETIAEGIGVSVGTVKTQLHRGRKALAARLGKEGRHV